MSGQILHGNHLDREWIPPSMRTNVVMPFNKIELKHYDNSLPYFRLLQLCTIFGNFPSIFNLMKTPILDIVSINIFLARSNIVSVKRFFWSKSDVNQTY